MTRKTNRKNSPDIQRLLTLLATDKQRISQFLKTFLADKTELYQAVSPLASDFSDRLYPFAEGGKMIRGILVLQMAEFLFRQKQAATDSICQPNQEQSRVKVYSNTKNPSPAITQQWLKAAGALELIQAALLMHDDIMDGDVVRRGQPTLHVQYQTEYATQSTSEVGRSLAICLGDEALFFALGLLAELPAKLAKPVIELTTKELIKTGLGQSQDVINAERTMVTREEITATYLYKTASYTFTIPLSVAAILTETATPQRLAAIEAFGEAIGMVFQLQDDYLGVFGDTTATGKGVISDVAENKKTFLRLAAFEAASTAELQWLETLFGNPEIGVDDILKLRQYLEKKQVVEQLEAEINHYYQQARQRLTELDLPPEGFSFFEQLLWYVKHRQA